MLNTPRSPKQGRSRVRKGLLHMDNKPSLIELAAQIVAAYVGRNTVEQVDLP